MRKFVILSLFFAAIVAMCGSVNADPQWGYNAVWEQANSRIRYFVYDSPDADSIIITATVAPSGVVAINPSNPPVLKLVTGDAEGYLNISCSGSGSATVTVKMARYSIPEVTIFTRDFSFACSGSGGTPVWSPPPPPSKVPTLTDWGLVILLAMLIATASWVLWRRQGQATA